MNENKFIIGNFSGNEMMINVNNIKQLWSESYHGGPGYRNCTYYSYYIQLTDGETYEINEELYKKIQSHLTFI